LHLPKCNLTYKLGGFLGWDGLHIEDVNWIIQNETFSVKLNGYYLYMGNPAGIGLSLFGFVGLKNGSTNISTFYIKAAAQLRL